LLNGREPMNRIKSAFLLAAILSISSYTLADKKSFQIEESSIDELHTAIQKGKTTCVDVVQAYLERARAYNGVCTQLVTKDGASIAPIPGTVRAGQALQFPTTTVAVDKLLPDFARYKGLPCLLYTSPSPRDH
jgi:amidase